MRDYQNGEPVQDCKRCDRLQQERDEAGRSATYWQADAMLRAKNEVFWRERAERAEARVREVEDGFNFQYGLAIIANRKVKELVARLAEMEGDARCHTGFDFCPEEARCPICTSYRERDAAEARVKELEEALLHLWKLVENCPMCMNADAVDAAEHVLRGGE